MLTPRPSVSHIRYGGIFERGSREITMDDFWSLALDKMDAYICLKPLTADVTSDGHESSSDEEDGDDDEDEDSEEGDDAGDSIRQGTQELADANESSEEEPDTNVRANYTFTSFNRLIFVHQAQLRERATDFLNAANNITTAEAASIPLPGETLALFYERTRDYWVQQAFATSANRGKELRRDGFALAEQRYGTLITFWFGA